MKRLRFSPSPVSPLLLRSRKSASERERERKRERSGMEIISAPRRRSRSSSQRPRRNCHFFCGTKEKEGGQSFSPSTLLRSAPNCDLWHDRLIEEAGGRGTMCVRCLWPKKEKGDQILFFPSLPPSFSTGESPLCFASLKGNPNHRPRWPFVRSSPLSSDFDFA